MCAAYDSSRNIALFCSSAGAVRLDVGAGTHTNFSITNGGPGNANGMIYVAATDRYYFRDNSSGGTVTQINPSTWASSSFSTTGGTSIPCTVEWLLQRLRLLPESRRRVLRRELHGRRVVPEDSRGLSGDVF